MSGKNIYFKNLTEHRDLIEMLYGIREQVERTAEIMSAALRLGGRIFLCGNGGSAADAQHMAAELSGRYLMDRKALDAVSLNTNVSAITAIGNDYSFDDIFARQLEAHGRSGDVLLVISTSGNSVNVLKALEKAKEIGIITIGLTGESGGEVGKIADLLIDVPSSSTPRIQEIHLLIEHTICEMIETLICDGDKE